MCNICWHSVIYRYILSFKLIYWGTVAWWLTPRTLFWVRAPLGSPCCVLEQEIVTPQKVLVIPRKRSLRPNMTEKIVSRDVKHQTNQTNQTHLLYILTLPHIQSIFCPSNSNVVFIDLPSFTEYILSFKLVTFPHIQIIFPFFKLLYSICWPSNSCEVYVCLQIHVQYKTH